MPLVAMDDDEGHFPDPVLEYEGDAPSLGTRDCDARAVETIISARAQ